MALTREKKEKIVTEIKDIALTASSLVISDARGLKVSEISEIRKDGNQSGIQIKVVKNSLAKLAFDGTDFNCTNEVLNGPSLFAFSFDEERCFHQFCYQKIDPRANFFSHQQSIVYMTNMDHDGDSIALIPNPF